MDRLEKIFYDELRYNSIDSKEDILNAMKTAYNQAVNDSANGAKIQEIFTDNYYSSNYNGNEHYSIHCDCNGEPLSLTEYVIDRNSILKLKIK